MAYTVSSDFSKGKVWKNIVRLAVPMILAQLINVLYNIVDRIYIGHIPVVGTAALTGVGVTFPILTLISAFSYFVGSGGAPQAAISMGRGDNDYAEKYSEAVLQALFLYRLFLRFLYLYSKEIYLWLSAQAKTQ